MNAKDKFVFGVLAALIVGAFYFQYLTDELNMRMDDLNLADKEHVDIVLNAISGYKGLFLSIQLLENKIDIALSNKESIVQAGSILTKLAKKNEVNIFPVDSEHSALWQCIIGEEMKFIDKLINAII